MHVRADSANQNHDVCAGRAGIQSAHPPFAARGHQSNLSSPRRKCLHDDETGRLAVWLAAIHTYMMHTVQKGHSGNIFENNYLIQSNIMARDKITGKKTLLSNNIGDENVIL